MRKTLREATILAVCMLAGLWVMGCADPSSGPGEPAAETAGQDAQAPEAGQAASPEGTHEHEVLEPAPPAAPAPAQPKPRAAAKPATRPAEPAPEKPAEPEPAPEPAWTEVQVAAGTLVAVQFDDALSSATSQPGDVFHARVLDPVMAGGREAIPAGSLVQGFVQDAKSAARWDKGGLLVLRFDLVQLPTGEAVPLVASLTAEAQSAGAKKKAAIIGGSAAGGAILGKILGKDTKDAAIGAAVGGAIGTGVLAAQKGEEVEVPVATPVFITVEQPLVVNVPA